MFHPIKFLNGKTQPRIRRIYTREIYPGTRYVRKSGQQNRELIGVLYKFRLTADERSAAIDREEIASW